MRRLKIAVLFDGAGLARLGLEMAGHDCTGYEIDPAKHHLSRMVGSGNSVLADVRDVDLSGYDGVWASPPCTAWSDQNHVGESRKRYGDKTMLEWALNLPHDILWVENVLSDKTDEIMRRYSRRMFTPKWNAAQFLPSPVQKRRRYVVGRYLPPFVYREFKHDYPALNVCPAVLASEYGQGGMASDPDKERRKASRWYGRPLSLREMAYHQGFDIPDGLLRSWFHNPQIVNAETGRPYTDAEWRVNISQAIGNGVPVFMARAFGEAYSLGRVNAQRELFAETERAA